MILEKENKRYRIKNDYLYLVMTLLISFFILYISVIYEKQIYYVFHNVNFLTKHIITELITIIISFIIFINCYHAYKHIKRIRLLILSMTFFIVGCIDFLHMISYEGMPYTFTESSIAAATTYWIIGRLIMSTGILITSVVYFYKKVKRINEKHILLISILIAMFLFYIVTYKVEYLPAIFIEGVGLVKLKISLEYLIMILQAMAVYFYLRTYKKLQSKYIILMCCGLVLSIFSEALFTLYRNVYDTYNLLAHVYKIGSFYLIYHSIFKYNVDMPYVQLKKAQDRIKLYANNLEKIVDKRTEQVKKVNDTLIKELDYAKNIQQALLPPHKISFQNVTFISEYIPCERLSGDFYDIYEIDNDNIGMYILDVSGHGVSAALLTMFSKNYIKSTERLIKRYRGLKPHKNLKNLYDEFNKLNFPEEMHMVVFYAAYNTTNKVLTYCSGGMNCYPILMRRDGGYEYLDKSKGFPICQFKDFYEPEYESAKIQLNAGDKIIFYTDGLTEKQKNTTIDKEVLINLLLENKDKNIEELNKKILSVLRGTKEVINDDITYFIMEIGH